MGPCVCVRRLEQWYPTSPKPPYIFGSPLTNRVRRPARPHSSPNLSSGSPPPSPRNTRLPRPRPPVFISLLHSLVSKSRPNCSFYSLGSLPRGLLFLIASPRTQPPSSSPIYSFAACLGRSRVVIIRLLPPSFLGGFRFNSAAVAGDLMRSSVCLVVAMSAQVRRQPSAPPTMAFFRGLTAVSRLRSRMVSGPFSGGAFVCFHAVSPIVGLWC